MFDFSNCEMKRLIGYSTIISLFFLLVHSTVGSAQESANFQRAKKLHHNYEFASAWSLYSSEKAVVDSLQIIEIENLMVQCDNGANMLHYASTPTVINTKTVAVKDFYLYYDQLKDKAWMANPNPFSGDTTHQYYTATYFYPNNGQLYFSKPDGEGRWNLYRSRLEGDTLWSVPALLSESLTSAGDEIFPLLSADGKKLYFSSNSMAGMGGYDIFVSELCADGISWSAPVNMGFPYSSPYDDFLYYDTPDGKFSMFASNRDCSADSVKIYILAFEANPIRRSISSVREAREIAALRPKISTSAKKEVMEALPEGNYGEFKEWYEAEAHLNAIQKSYSALGEEMAKLREAYSKADQAQKVAISKDISDAEWVAMELQGKLSKAKARMGAVEADFIAKGKELPSASRNETLPQITQGAQENFQDLKYTFTRNSYGKMESVRIAEPEPEFDWTFKIGDTAVIVEDNTLPKGIVFQAQLCAVSSKLSAKKFRGMSPIFEVKTRSGKYIYYAGLFKSCQEAEAALGKIKKCGFSSAYVVAFKDGKSIEVKTAKSLTK